MKRETPRPARLLGLFAHPDDEIFCAGGTFAKYARAGAVTMVVSATRGEAGQIRDAAAATRRTLGTVREAELRQAGAALGVTYTRCLSYQDGGLQDVDPSVLSAEVAALIGAFQPDAVVTFGADGAYGHPDHIAISHAVTSACRRAARATAGIQLFYSAFPQNQLLLAERLAQVVHTHAGDAECSPALAQALALVAEDLAMMGCARDHVQVRWFPAGLSIVEQGEVRQGLQLVLSGHVDVVEEDEDGRPHRLARRGPGYCFGESPLVDGRPRTAAVVASEPVTCLVLSPHPPTRYAGRGPGALLTCLAAARQPAAAQRPNPPMTCIDVSPFVAHKVAGLAAHRTQYPIDPAAFPAALLQDLFGREYFVPAHASLLGQPPLDMEWHAIAG